ncbi:Lrp/AsnC family transcriptional regulator [Candidatus Nomurabacteria bacterium]|nr:Lrp/AsnC family transcriptional regulator [Candidatus Nomurabacteria bacterium]
MKLSAKEKKVLAYSMMNAKMSVRELAKQTGYKSHNITYTLSKLKQSGIIHQVALVNLCPFGYTEYGVYFSLQTPDSATRKKILDRFLDSQDVPWVIELGGEYQYALAFRAKSVIDVTDMMDNVSEEFGNVFLHKSIHVRLFVTLYTRKFFSPNVPLMKPTIFETRTHVPHDDLDLRIAYALEKNGGLSSYDISKLLQQPPSTIKKRIKKLEANKVIAGNIYAYDHVKGGTQMYELFLLCNTSDKTMRKKLQSFSEKHPNVVHFLQGVGEWDFELGIDVEKNEDVTLITEEIYKQFGNEITSMKVLPIFSLPKIFSLPILNALKKSLHTSFQPQ